MPENKFDMQDPDELSLDDLDNVYAGHPYADAKNMENPDLYRPKFNEQRGQNTTGKLSEEGLNNIRGGYPNPKVAIRNQIEELKKMENELILPSQGRGRK